MLLIKVKDINVNMVQSLHTSVRQTSNLKHHHLVAKIAFNYNIVNMEN